MIKIEQVSHREAGDIFYSYILWISNWNEYQDTFCVSKSYFSQWIWRISLVFSILKYKHKQITGKQGTWGSSDLLCTGVFSSSPSTTGDVCCPELFVQRPYDALLPSRDVSGVLGRNGRALANVWPRKGAKGSFSLTEGAVELDSLSAWVCSMTLPQRWQRDFPSSFPRVVATVVLLVQTHASSLSIPLKFVRCSGGWTWLFSSTSCSWLVSPPVASSSSWYTSPLSKSSLTLSAGCSYST